MHPHPSPLAGSTVKVKESASHPHLPFLGGSDFFVVDWWDRLAQESWATVPCDHRCLVYTLRSTDKRLPRDDEVLYGYIIFNETAKKATKVDCLIHISEIDWKLNPQYQEVENNITVENFVNVSM